MKLLTSPLSVALQEFRFAEMVPVVVPVAGIIFAGVIIVTAMYFQNRRREMWHLTARLALERGQPIPALPEDPSDDRQASDPINDIRAGFICVAVGVGLYIFLSALISQALGYVGAIPGLVGLALLLSGIVRLMTTRDAAPGPDSHRS